MTTFLSHARTVLLALAFLVTSAAFTRAHATEVGGRRNFGLGLAVGSATSIVGKYFLGGDNAIDFGVSFWHWHRGCWYDRNGVRYCNGYYGDTYRRSSFALHGNYLWQDTLVRQRNTLDWHIGVGGRYHRFADDYRYYSSDRYFSLAARMPIGLDLTFARPSFLELYFEAVPLLILVPVVELDAEAFLGARFYF